MFWKVLDLGEELADVHDGVARGGHERELHPAEERLHHQLVVLVRGHHFSLLEKSLRSCRSVISIPPWTPYDQGPTSSVK